MHRRLVSNLNEIKMRLQRSIPWRYVLPGAVLPFSLVSWVEYRLSIRAFDDAPAPWYWYGGLVSACLNFPAYIYSVPFEPFFHRRLHFGRLYIEPRMVSFFLIVMFFWHSLGERAENWRSGKRQDSVAKKRSATQIIVLGFFAALWLLVTAGTVADSAFLLEGTSWYAFLHLWRDIEIMKLAELSWCAILAGYYCRAFTQVLRARGQ